VRARREALFTAQMTNGAEEAALSARHCRRHLGEEAWAPMMRRETSQTKGITQVRIDAANATCGIGAAKRAIANGLAAPDQTLFLPHLTAGR
jgi:hypothetical protein